MNLSTAIAGIVVLLIIVMGLFSQLRRLKKTEKKGGCTSGCAACPYAKHCHGQSRMSI